MALLRSTADDGWTRESGRPGLRHSVIATRCGRSASRIKHLLRLMRRRSVIEAQGNLKLDGKSSGEAAEYRILPQDRWRPRNSAGKPRLRIPALRMFARDGAVRLAIPGKGTTEPLAGESEVTLGAGGRKAVTITGADLSSVRIPEGARVDIAGDIALIPEKTTPLPRATPKGSAQSVPGSPATPLTMAADGRNHALPGSPATPLPMNNVVVACAGGHVKVWFPVGRRLTTESESRALRGMTVDDALQLFAAKGFRAVACITEQRPPKEVAMKAVELDGPPTGIWDRLKVRLKSSINPHTFSTWLGPTREAGTKDGVVIVAVPDRVFARRIVSHFNNFIQTGLKDIGERNCSIEYRPFAEFDEIPAAAPAGAGKQQTQSQRRIA